MLGVGGLSLEGQAVDGVLWVSLMENVLLSVVPVGEARHVARRLLDGLWHVLKLLVLWQLVNSSLLGEGDFVRSAQVHLVRVDDLSFLLQVERLLVAIHFCLSQLAIVVLTVVGEEGPWIWITHESVSAPRLS